jgi:flagellar basal-body rod protein FlgC
MKGESMSIRGVGNPIDIAVSGLQAESARMRVIAGNIANAHTTRTPSGEPFRRQDVVISTDDSLLGGVKIEDIAPDWGTDFKTIHQPGHPDADEEGYVRMPNINLPIEMTNMISASRAYQANAAIMKRYQEMVDVATELLR